jgi:AraC-like DNA-binding protein
MASPKTKLDCVFGLRVWSGEPMPMGVSHRHNDLELNFVERGSVTYRFGGTRYTIDEGSLALFWAVAPHQLVASSDRSHMHWATLPLSWFLRASLPEPLTRAVLAGRPLGTRADADLDLGRFVAWAKDLATPSLESAQIVLLEIEARLRRWALELSAPPRRQSTRRIDRPSGMHKAEQIAELLSTDCTQDWHIDAVARRVNLHPNYAMTVFRQAFGVSIIDFLTQQRIALAQQLLVTTDLTVLDIAHRAGFGSASQFYTAFRRWCGVAPRAYRLTITG